MNESDLLQRISERTGASPQEVRAVVKEFFPQAFSAALERGGTLVVARFATFKCGPRGGGGMKFHFRPRTPDELIASGRRRGEKLAGRRAGGGGGFEGMPARLSGEPYVPRPLPAIEAGRRERGPAQRPGRRAPGREFGDEPRKRGFFARLFGWGE